MTAKIKLNAASGGGSFSLQAPSSSSNNRVFTIPDVADGTIATTATAGKILQVKSATKTDAFTNNSQSFVDITGLSVDMALSGSSNKILISFDVTFGGQWWTAGPAALRLVQDSTGIALGTSGADANRNPTTFANYYADGSVNSPYNISSSSSQFLFSPSDTNNHTYKLQGRIQGSGTFAVNRTAANADYGSISTLTLMEVSA